MAMAGSGLIGSARGGSYAISLHSQCRNRMGIHSTGRKIKRGTGSVTVRMNNAGMSSSKRIGEESALRKGVFGRKLALHCHVQ